MSTFVLIPGAGGAAYGIDPDVLPGGHLIALAHPESVADYLLQGG